MRRQDHLAGQGPAPVGYPDLHAQPEFVKLVSDIAYDQTAGVGQTHHGLVGRYVLPLIDGSQVHDPPGHRSAQDGFFQFAFQFAQFQFRHLNFAFGRPNFVLVFERQLLVRILLHLDAVGHPAEFERRQRSRDAVFDLQLLF